MKIADKFKQLKKDKKKAFIAYVPFGFPTINHTKKIILALQDAGVDIIELGIPFSDPLADGPIIQEATTIALKKGATLEKLFSFLSSIKKSLKVPLVIMTYYNPVFHYGQDKFFAKLKKADVSGIMAVDLPVEESKQYIKTAKKHKLDTVFFITPTTSASRARNIAKVSKGFIYYISVTGITGPKSLKYGKLSNHLSKLKRMTKLPICIGFGVHTKDQVKQLSRISDGVIVGSAIVKFIKQNHPETKFYRPERSFYQLLLSRSFPTKCTRWCCDDLKKKPTRVIPFKKRLMGLRAEESSKRAQKPQIDKFRNGDIIYKPIFYWKEWEIWDHIERYNLPYCSLYDEGFARIGCVICPFICQKNQAKINIHKKRTKPF